MKVSVLFRSVELTLPPRLLGYDVGTFEVTSSRILALNYHSVAKLKARTGGSTDKLRRSACHKLAEGDGVYWDASSFRLPVRYRYRSPVVLELHLTGKRKADAFAMIWLQHLVDNEETPIDIPIWRSSNPARVMQNFVTEDDVKSVYEDVTEIGRIQFRGRFKAGMDESHERFVQSNDDRETYETWLCCKQEGVRDRIVTKEVPESIRTKHQQSLMQARDMLKQDPTKVLKSGSIQDDDDEENASSTSSDSDLGVQDRTNAESGTTNGTTGGADEEDEKGKKEALHRKHRGLMQWKPARNVAFAKDEAMIGIRKITGKMRGNLGGREPQVESELG